MTASVGLDGSRLAPVVAGVDRLERGLEVVRRQFDVLDVGGLAVRRRADVFSDGGLGSPPADRLDVGRDVAVGAVGQVIEVDVVGQRPLAGVNLEYLPPGRLVRVVDLDVAVEPSRAVGGRDHHDVLQLLEAVQLRQQLRDHPLADVAVAEPLAALGATASISSEKTTAGAFSRALANTSRTPFSDSPTYVSNSSGPLTEMKFARASSATAFVSSVLPVPGGPYRSTPLAGSSATRS